jgi:superfamily II DNA or RNA helicase
MAATNNDIFTQAEQFVQYFRHAVASVLSQNNISQPDINDILASLQVDSGIYISRNPHYQRSANTFSQFCDRLGLSHRVRDAVDAQLAQSTAFRLYVHQEEAIQAIRDHWNTVISTGTGSGKTESFLIPLLDHCYRNPDQGVQAIIIYPMNALASDQVNRLGRYTQSLGIPFGIYTGTTPRNAEDREVTSEFPNQLLYRDDMIKNAPAILVTNYVMLDWMLTRPTDFPVFKAARNLRFIVLDEVHMYGGSKGAHIRLLLSRLKNYAEGPVVHVGTSATLSKAPHANERLNRFVSDLFDIPNGDYTLITATEVAEPAPSIQSVPDFDVDLLPEVTFAEGSQEASFALLTGYPLQKQEILVHPENVPQSEAYQALSGNAFVWAARQALRQSALSFPELAAIMRECVHNRNLSQTDINRLTRAYLQAITYLNTFVDAAEHRILDYRCHIFIRDLSGILKSCPKCGTYYTGNTRFCTRDGFTLFAVARNDVSQNIAKFSAQHMTPELKPEATDASNVHYVVFGKAGKSVPSEMSLRGNIGQRGQFTPDEDGEYIFEPLTAPNKEQLEAQLIPLRDPRKDYQYLHRLISGIFQTSEKCLAFSDNRERASRYSSILRDELASDFLEGFLLVHHPREQDYDLSKTLMYLQKQAERIADGALAKAILDELPLWFYRYIALPERFGGSEGMLQLRDTDETQGLSELERELLAIFLRERAIEKPPLEAENAQYVRFQHYLATKSFGIYAEGKASKSTDFRGLALTDQAQVYREFTAKWSLEDRASALDELVERGVLTTRLSPEGTRFYYLDSRHVQLRLPDSRYGYDEAGYKKLCKFLPRTCQLHSSDVLSKTREQVEADFRQGRVQCVIATPTLEVGIDIGDLNAVVMIGAPPSPANYVQRAGRAGRGSKKGALIVTFCAADSAHDSYAFENPKWLVNGHVAPPSFSANNPEILKQHINAYLLGKHLRDTKALPQSWDETLSLINSERVNLHRLFGSGLPYVDADFGWVWNQVERLRSETHGKIGSVLWHGYQEGIFPDYNFSRDEVIAVDCEEAKRHKERRPGHGSPETRSLRDLALTTRTNEQAFTFFVPGQTNYMAGDVYKTLADGEFSMLSDGARQYSCFYVRKEDGFAERHKDGIMLESERHFKAPVASHGRAGILQTGYFDQSVLSFRNYGPRTDHEEKADQSFPPMGFDLERNAFYLRFDPDVCSDAIVYSFSAALTRAIHNRYLLAEGELRVMFDLAHPDDENGRYVVLYDATGNANLPLHEIERDFDTLVNTAYLRLCDCDCATDGCYHCLRNYSFQFFDASLSRSVARMVCGYLLGKERFVPDIVPFDAPPTEFDLRLRIESSGPTITVCSNHGNAYSDISSGDENTTRFSLLTKAIREEGRATGQNLFIETREAWLADAINARKVKKGEAAFAQFQFALLRFKHVKAGTASKKVKVS